MPYVYDIGLSFLWLVNHYATIAITISGKPPSAKAAAAIISYDLNMLIFQKMEI